MLSTLLRSQWDRIAAWVAAGLGVVLLVVGWIGVSRTAYPAEQIPYLASAGLGALFLLGIAGTLWISADLRDEYAKLDEIAQALGQDQPTPIESHAVATGAVVELTGPTRQQRSARRPVKPRVAPRA